MSQRRTELVIDARTTLARWFVERCARLAADAIAARGSASIAIAGGSAADAFLPSLGAAPITWEEVDVFWCDERDVPVADPASNYGEALRLLAGSDMPVRARIHPMATSRVARLADAAAYYGQTLENIIGRPPVLDLVVLGVGEDGHVASLFPRSRALAERNQLVTAVTDAPKPPPRRLTLTMPVLQLARTICVAAFGLEKADALHESLRDPTADTPLATLLRSEGDAWILLDSAAASRLER